MCKFHKNIARDIATDPETDVFDAGRYCVALVAMAKFRIEQYMPAMHSYDGFNPAVLRTETAIQALNESGIKKPVQEVEDYRHAHIADMRSAMARTAKAFDLSMDALKVPDIITREGYKHCAKMAPDPTKNGPFLDEAIVELFEGYDDEKKTWARHELRLVAEAHKPEFEAIRTAADHFLSQPDVTPVLRNMFENLLVYVFEEARTNEDDAGLESDGCVMCGHGSRAEAFNAASVATAAAPAAETQGPEKQEPPASLFKKLTGMFNLRACATCVGSGAWGGVLAHMPCALTAALGGAGGAALSMQMMSLMVYTSPAIAMGMTAGLDLLRSRRISLPKVAASGLIGLGVALGVHHLTMRDMPDMPNMQDLPMHHHDMGKMGMTMDICGQPPVRTAILVRP